MLGVEDTLYVGYGGHIVCFACWLWRTHCMLGVEDILHVGCGGHIVC